MLSKVLVSLPKLLAPPIVYVNLFGRTLATHSVYKFGIKNNSYSRALPNFWRQIFNIAACILFPFTAYTCDDLCQKFSIIWYRVSTNCKCQIFRKTNNLIRKYLIDGLFVHCLCRNVENSTHVLLKAYTPTILETASSICEILTCKSCRIS